MAEHKPHKKIINDMKDRYFTAKTEARSRRFSKAQEIDLCYLQDEIERRWFRFFADHYITETVDQYVALVYKGKR